MLQFVLGGAKTGKSSRIADEIARLSESGEPLLLIVPEQFTFETEKALFRRLGGEQFRHVNVTSFTRLSTEIFRKYGGIAGQYAGDCAKLVLMERTVDEFRDKLEVYQKSAKNRGFAVSMLDTVSELKNVGVTSEALDGCAALLPEGFLQKKARETAELFAAYQALLETSYLDSLDDLSRAAAIVRGTDFFAGSRVFLDEFKGFTATEYEFIRLILQKAESLTVSLCIDPRRLGGIAGNGDAHSRTGVFASLAEAWERITRLARQVGRPVKAPVELGEPRFDAPELCHLEQNLFSPVVAKYEGGCRAVRAVLCQNEYDEVDYALSSIAALVQDESYRYQDIAVISRDLDTYLPRLEAAFPKYGIPYYSDREAPVANHPLIRFVQNALACLTGGFTGENVLALLKCGVTPGTVEEVAELENYVFVWDIGAKQWQEPFTQSPRGFRDELSAEDAEALGRINLLREFIVERLNRFRAAAKEGSGRQVCAAVVELLEDAQVRPTLEQQIERFYAAENYELAAEYARVWDILMDILDEIAAAAGDKPVSAEQFAAYYALSVSAYGMGVLPQSLDCVTVGAADRIRVAGKRAVFILGVNENVLPYTPTGGGVFTDRERELLLSLEIDIAKPVKEKIKEERFVAYKTLCSPSERLVLTARKADIAGGAMSPSVLFSELRRMFGPGVVTDTGDLPGEAYCRSGDSAFSALAERYLDDTPLTASLKQVLAEEGYGPRLCGLARTLENRAFSIQDRKNAVALFGRSLKVSPTRVEGFYQCRFRYFMEQGIRAFPLKKAELDPLETGTLIHKVLFAVTRQLDWKENYDRELVKKLIKQELDDYIASVMGGVRDKTNRFLYLYNRMRLSILKIVEQLHEELSQSRFTPCDYEYEIADGADITPLRLLDGDGTEIVVSGKVDRIDSYRNKKGETFVRIVDYKSGAKSFKLNDVLYGLNLQMLIYLHCISANGRGKFEASLPAGILYMPAGEQPPSLPRDADDEAVARQKRKSYAMNGLILADPEVVEAMEPAMQGIFIPVSANKDGSFSKNSLDSLVTLSELGKINAYVDRLVVNMARELHAGRVEALPVEGSCAYCNYRGVCGINRASAVTRIAERSREEVYAAIGAELSGEGDEGNA